MRKNVNISTEHTQKYDSEGTSALSISANKKNEKLSSRILVHIKAGGFRAGSTYAT